MYVDWLHYAGQEQADSGCFSMYLYIYSAACVSMGKHTY